MPLFVDTSPPGQCNFCRLVAREIPSARVAEDELTLAFMDLGQVNPGHVLVASKRHAATLFDLTPDEAGAVMRMAQRVALARSLAKKPKVLLLDEPLGALDKKLREETQFELMDLQQELGLTFVIVTHDPRAATTPCRDCHA